MQTTKRVVPVLISASLLWACAHMSRAGGKEKAPDSSPGIRPARSAYYDKDPRRLEASVASCLRQGTRAEVKGRLVAAVAPHALHRHSGQCSGSLYRLVKPGQYSRIIILGPDHSSRFHGICLPETNMVAYRTPLGDVPIDQDICKELAKEKGFAVFPGKDRKEHSIENQLPFIQKTAGNITFVPLLCGKIREGQLGSMAESILKHVDKKTLVLSTSDFTHYGPHYRFQPFKRHERDKNLRAWLDKSTQLIVDLDLEGFIQHRKETGDTICGPRAIEILISLLNKSDPVEHGRVLATNIAPFSASDQENLVSFAAIGFFVVGSSGEKQ